MNIDTRFLAVMVFIVLYATVITIQPSFIYNHTQGSLRPFGIGYKNTTIMSLWFVSILLAILSYFLVVYVYNVQNLWF